MAAVAKIRSALFMAWPHLHFARICHRFSGGMKRAKSQENERADRRLRAIVRLKRTGHEIERSRRPKPERRPVGASYLADVTELRSADIEALAGWQSRQQDSSAGCHRIHHDQFFRAFLN